MAAAAVDATRCGVGSERRAGDWRLGCAAVTLCGGSPTPSFLGWRQLLLWLWRAAVCCVSSIGGLAVVHFFRAYAATVRRQNAGL